MSQKKICCIEGCENKVRARGYCNKHYYQLMRNGKLEKIRPQYDTMCVCEVEGCKKTATSMGFCSKHYKRWYDTGSPDEKDLQRPVKTKGVSGLSIKERLEKFSKENTETGCIEWTGSVDVDGYGQTEFKGKNYRTHRLSYETYVGPIPEGKIVCHHCDNPVCINTNHLYVGTHKDNVRDRMERGRANIPTGEKSASSKLTEKQAIELIRDKKSGVKTSEIAEKFGVSYYTVMEIMRGRSWKSLDRDSIEPYNKNVVRNSVGKINSNKQTKLTENQVRKIKNKLSKGKSLNSLAEKFGVSKKLISDIKKGKAWNHVKIRKVNRRKKRKV